MTKTGGNVAMDKLGLQQLLVKTEAELVDVQSQISQAEKALVSHQSELETLTERAQSRNQALQMANQTVTQLQSELEQVRTRVSLAQGTLAHTDESSTNDLEKRLERAEEDLTQLQIRSSKEESADADRRATVQPQLAKCQSFIAGLKPRMQALAKTKKDVYQELGECELEEQKHLLQEAQSELLTAEHQARLVRAKLDELSKAALRALEPYGSLQSQIKPLCTYRDNSTNVMEAMINFLDTLLNEGFQSNLPVENILYLTGLNHFRSLSEILHIEQSDLDPAFHRLQAPIALQDKQKHLQQVLTVYREEKKR